MWGMECCNMLEHIRIRYFKMILKLNTKTPNYIVLGETGKLYLNSMVKKRILNFWIKIATGKLNRTSRIIYNMLIKDRLSDQFKWTAWIKLQLDMLGLGYMWLEQQNFDGRMSESIINSRIKDQTIQQIHESMQNSYKGKLYNFIKSMFAWEDLPPFLDKLPFKEAFPILKIRTSNNRFPVELGRYTGINHENRLCPSCLNGVGDAYHYLLECKKFDSHRKKIFKEVFLHQT